jgi:hypothetical protein
VRLVDAIRGVSLTGRLPFAVPTLCLLGLLAWTSWLQLLVSLRILQWDSHVFVLIGRWWLHGIWPYRDAWELKPPGIFLYLAGVFAVLGEAVWSIRVANWLLACASTVAAFVFLFRQSGLLAAFLGAGAWTYWSAHAYFVWGGVYTELYAATLSWGACALASSGRATAAGAAVAGALLFKHPAATVLVPVAWLLGPRAAPRLALGAGAVLLPVVGAAWLIPGMWQPFIECNWTGLFAHGEIGAGTPWTMRLTQLWGSLTELATRFPIASLFVVAGTATAPLAALGWFVADLVGVMAQRNFYDHHWVLAFPSAIWVASSALRRPLIGALAIAMLALCFPLYWRATAPNALVAWQRWTSGDWPVVTARPFEDEVGRYVNAHTLPSERIVVFGWNANGLGVYWSAQRLPAIRRFFGPCCGTSMAMVMAEIDQHQPAAVVLAGIPDDSPLRPWLAKSYRLDRRFAYDYVADVWLRGSNGAVSD